MLVFKSLTSPFLPFLNSLLSLTSSFLGFLDSFNSSLASKILFFVLKSKTELSEELSRSALGLSLAFPDFAFFFFRSSGLFSSLGRSFLFLLRRSVFLGLALLITIRVCLKYVII